MAVVLTNGEYYIAHSSTGATIKVSDMHQAQDFRSVERAVAQKNKAPGKCAGYYFIDTNIMDKIEPEKKSRAKKHTVKRKSFSVRERLLIYRKTKGHCYLCGEFVDFDEFEIEHKVPVSRGGTNEQSNLFCACHCCNTIKHDIYPDDFMKKITQIFMYQMKKKHGNGFRWKVVCWLLSLL